MSWAKLDDQFPQHPKVLRAGPDAAWLHVCAVCYCAQYLTDGFVPKEAVATLSTLRQPARLAARLVEVGLWHDRGDQFEVHDYLAYNPTREKVEGERAAAKDRRSKSGQKGGRSPTRRRNVAETSPDVRANEPSPVPEPESPTDSMAPPSGESKKARQTSFYGALVNVFGEPGTPSRESLFWSSAAEFLAVEDATPAEVVKRGRKMLTLGWTQPTPKALLKHWPGLNGSSSSRPRCQEHPDRGCVFFEGTGWMHSDKVTA